MLAAVRPAPSFPTIIPRIKGVCKQVSGAEIKSLAHMAKVKLSTRAVLVHTTDT